MNIQAIARLRPMFRDILKSPCPMLLEVRMEEHSVAIDLTPDLAGHLVTIRSGDRVLWTTGLVGIPVDEDMLCFIVIRSIREAERQVD